MGGHGGLNILPQKRWNVYNFDNREKVRKDEEAAAREASIQEQQQRQKDAEARIAKLRDAKRSRGPENGEMPSTDPTDILSENPSEQHADDIHHIELFHGLVSFQRLKPGDAVSSQEYKGSNQIDKKMFRGDKELERLYKRATKEATKVGKDGVEADDEHYRLGYGCLDRNRKRPWYTMKSSLADEPESAMASTKCSGTSSEKKQKKSIAELREERLMREKQERERVQKMLSTRQAGQPSKGAGEKGGHHYYNSSFGYARRVY